MTNEGTRRIYLLAKFIMLLGPLAGIIGYWNMTSDRPMMAWAGLIILVALPLVVGGSLWAITWIVEGFMTGHK